MGALLPYYCAQLRMGEGGGHIVDCRNEFNDTFSHKRNEKQHLHILITTSISLCFYVFWNYRHNDCRWLAANVATGQL